MPTLNPDAYPSATNHRFSVFIITVGAQAWILGDWYANFLPPPFNAIEDVYISVLVCAYSYLMAYLIYLLHPGIIIKKEKLTELSPVAHPQLYSTLEKLAKVTGCQTPRIFGSENFRRQSAKVFGLGHQKVLKLDGGLILMRTRAPNKFEAILLHELAHIKYRDIFKGYYARCLFWVAFVATLPIIIFRGTSYIIQFINIYPTMLAHLEAGNYKWFGLWHLQNIPYFLSSIAPFLFMQLILTLEYCAILKAREHHADWAASVHGARGTLLSIFESTQTFSKNKISDLFNKHPRPAMRASFISHPEKAAFEITRLDAFLTSYTLCTIFQIIVLTTELISAVLGTDWLDSYSSLLIAAPLLTIGGAYAVIIWSRMIQKFSMGEWLAKSQWKAKVLHFTQLHFYATLGTFAGAVFWPEQFYSAVTLSDLADSFKDMLIFLPALLASAYFSLIFTLFGIPRSEGNSKPKSLFIIGHLISLCGFNLGMLYSIYLHRTPDINEKFEALGMPLLPITLSGIAQSLIYLGLLFGLFKLLMRRRSKVSPEVLAPAWLLIPD
ncbi:M48 family metalloprotease [Pseudomonas chlororaphis]|uniref:M48 family metalloprotease n=1 Tax=Pseudomonas chlororaphis TaxID=587753 RepID=UPI000BE3F9A8|nr:M48 family metalloprotease [Pseudomonas chlororaphis]